MESKTGYCLSGVGPCMYYRASDQAILIVAIYVDDIVIFASNENSLTKQKQYLSNKFRMKDMDETRQYLLIRITSNGKQGKLWLDQEIYTKQTIKRFDMANSNLLKTPLNES